MKIYWYTTDYQKTYCLESNWPIDQPCLLKNVHVRIQFYSATIIPLDYTQHVKSMKEKWAPKLWSHHLTLLLIIWHILLSCRQYTPYYMIFDVTILVTPPIRSFFSCLNKVKLQIHVHVLMTYVIWSLQISSWGLVWGRTRSFTWEIHWVLEMFSCGMLLAVGFAPLGKETLALQIHLTRLKCRKVI